MRAETICADTWLILELLKHLSNVKSVSLLCENTWKRDTGSLGLVIPVSERLTNEQLRLFDKHRNPDVRSMAAELMITRAKLKSLGKILNEYANHPLISKITKEIAGQ